MDVGVRELRQRLAELLDRAEQGELIRVTDRGRPKVVIALIPGLGTYEAGVAGGCGGRAGGVPVRVAW